MTGRQLSSADYHAHAAAMAGSEAAGCVLRQVKEVCTPLQAADVQGSDDKDCGNMPSKQH